MENELDKLYKEYQSLSMDAKILLSTSQSSRVELEQHLTEIMDEYSRVVNICGQAGYVLDKIDKDFQEKTQLCGWEIVLLFISTGLQCIRQYLIPNNSFRLSATQGDKLIDNTIGHLIPPKWEDVLLSPSVPYDAIQTGEHVQKTGLGGNTHRYRTLGHDPLLGWIFGTSNIMTNSLTKYNFETFQVKDMKLIRRYPNGVVGMLERAGTYSSNDSKLLFASLGRQAIHFGSDFFTKQGLPIPLISTLNNDLSKQLITKCNIDTYSILRGAGISMLINKLIFMLHQLFYREDRDGSQELYEVKTRKILSYSNVIATGSNIIVSAVSQNPKVLDIGGLLVTIYRLISDYKFIHKIKQEFLSEQFEKVINGNHYSFMEEK